MLTSATICVFIVPFGESRLLLLSLRESPRNTLVANRFLFSSHPSRPSRGSRDASRLLRISSTTSRERVFAPVSDFGALFSLSHNRRSPLFLISIGVASNCYFLLDSRDFSSFAYFPILFLSASFLPSRGEKFSPHNTQLRTRHANLATSI
jgi:hypothetical protein